MFLKGRKLQFFVMENFGMAMIGSIRRIISKAEEITGFLKLNEIWPEIGK